MSDKPTIAGFPVEDFFGRRVRLRNKAAGHMIAATLVGGAGGTQVVVQPDGHKGTEKVEVERVHPWWSQNPDLKKIYDERVADGELKEVEVEPEEEEAPQEAVEIQLPEMVIDAGANPEHWYAKLGELQAAKTEEAELESMLKPVRNRINTIASQLKKLGVHIMK